ncbi:unnamed protein product [Cladocopium goreaui]|uniref:Uncharacterized protein n=1 Tax=Cladocopium goreaui TaxID=2562237 RepID=A0A9P1G701_9DINO|nr:unnamed protein product [Cladocopium goreaui]
MGQCYPCGFNLWSPSPRAAPKETDGKDGQEILLEQLESFGCLGATLVREAAAEYSFDSSLDDEEWEQQWLRWKMAIDVGEEMWSAAFQLIEALLQGVMDHLPQAINHAELDGASLKVFFNEELLGEFATRSRMGAQIRLEKELRFILSVPTDSWRPLIVEVIGLDFPALPRAVELREDLLKTLGSDFSRSAAFKCWQERKEEFPLQSSKLRRVHESLAQYYLPAYVAEKAFWGYLNAPPQGCSGVHSLEFHQEGGEVRVTARRRQPTAQSQLEQLALIDDLCIEVLLQDRFLGEQFAPSSMNFLAMTHGHAAGQKGADPKKIAKLMSAAKSWGPGTDGWHRFDETWTCTDQKDWLGRTIEEQGRVLWHKPGFQLT